MKIGYSNLAFSEDHALTVTGATVETGALANLRVAQLDQRVTVRSSGTGARVLYIEDAPTVATGRTVQVIALLDIAVETVGEITGVTFDVSASGSSGGFSSTLVDVPLMPDGFPRHLLMVLPDPVEDCSEVRVFVTGAADIAETTELALTASALWIGPLQIITTSNGGALEESSAYGVEDGGTVQRTPGGQVYGEPAGAIRTHNGNTVYITRTEAFGDGSGGMDVQQLMASARTTSPILWIPDDSTEHLLHRLTIYGQMTQVGRLVPRGPYVQWQGWQVRESR